MNNYLGIPILLTPILLLVFASLFSIYLGVFAWGFQFIQRRAAGAWPFAIASWFCALEFIMPQLFTYYQGAAWYQYPQIFLITSLTGVSGMSFMVILCNALIVQFIDFIPEWGKHRKTLFSNMGVFFLLMLIAFSYSSLRLVRITTIEADARPFEIAIIQPNYSVENKEELYRHGPTSYAEDLVSLSRIVAGTKLDEIDVYIWPENALSKPPYGSHNKQVIDFAYQTKSEIWTGTLYQDSLEIGTSMFRNSAFRIDQDGEVDDRYDKTLLIPFGEYVPMRDKLPFLNRVQLPGNFKAGEGIKIHTSEIGKFSFLICYEAIKSGYVRSAIQGGAELLVNISGDVQSGNHSEQSQYLMLTAIQAAQYGVPLVRSTSTGISAYVNARGTIMKQMQVFDRGGIVCSVKPMRVPSFYAKHGDWFAWICVSTSVLFMITNWRSIEQLYLRRRDI